MSQSAHSPYAPPASVPSIMVGEHVFVDKTSTHPALGDIVVFHFRRSPIETS